tara:strand:+ start:63 stop:227 length:165 start_codon:yes stop_codon:yes gene_type:complete
MSFKCYKVYLRVWADKEDGFQGTSPCFPSKQKARDWVSVKLKQYQGQQHAIVYI